MTDFHTALLDFWEQFGVPAYVASGVDDEAAFPYLVIDIVKPAAFGTTVLTAISWHRDSTIGAAMAERAALLEQIATALPEDGVRIRFDGGYMILRRNTANFQSYMADETDLSIIAGRTSYELTYYGM